MRHLFTTIVFSLWPFALIAQPVLVQTGEHNGFTRVVVRLPADADWTFGRDAQGYVLRLPVSDGYSLGRFFDLIPRTRIKDVSQNVTRGEMALALGCICRADVFVTDNGFLVIDVANGAPDSGSPYEQVLQSPSGAPPAGPRILPVVFPRQSVSPIVVPFSPGAQTRTPPGQPLLPSDPDGIQAFEQLVVESLGRGLSDGILDPDLGNLAPAPRSVLPLERPAQLPGVVFRDGTDLIAVPQTNETILDAGGHTCVDDSFVDLGNWAETTPFHSQMSSLRARLVQEFDQVDAEIITHMARLYLHFGFGREAAQILALDANQSQERHYLTLLAKIIDDDPVDAPDLDRQSTCLSQIALWAMLAGSGNPAPDDQRRAVVLQTFKNFPIAMQRHLGPRLAERFLLLQDEDAASQIMAVADAADPQLVTTQLTAATLAEQQGDAAASLDTLTTMAATNPRLTAEAMTRYLLETVAQNQTVPAENMILADALRFETALTPAAGTLAAAQVQAYIAANAFSPAAEILAQERTALGPDRFNQLWEDYAVAAASRMDDTDFLAFVFATLPPTLRSDFQEIAAKRLIDLGFPDQAVNILGRGEPVLPGDARLYLQSTALLDLRDPQSALRVLRDDTSTQAEQLRAVARRMQAGNDTALASLATPESMENQWRNGDWASLAQADDAVIEDAAAAILDTNAAPFDDTRPLASGRSLLDQSAQSRAMLSALFDRFAAPDEF